MPRRHLQEDLSVKAVFGGVDPFTKAESLGNRSSELLGALKGSARAGSARQLQTGIEALDQEMRSLSGTKDDWARIETELDAENRRRERLESDLQERRGALRSARLALQAVADGVAAERARASSALADTPEPSGADRRLHEQSTAARARIGELRAAENEVGSARRDFETALETVDGDWRHRKTRQPGLLGRTQELACEVADWTNVTVNPHAPTTRRSTGTDNMLVDGPQGEHSDQRLSLGARTLLYLALRLATVEEQAEACGVRLPLILDDVLVGLDDERAERCLKVLAKFSERHQMILLTCHESTKQRAEAAGAVVLSIPPA